MKRFCFVALLALVGCIPAIAALFGVILFFSNHASDKEIAIYWLSSGSIGVWCSWALSKWIVYGKDGKIE